MSDPNHPDRQLLSDNKDWLALFLCITIFSSWVYLLTSKFLHFGYYDWDLALYAQAMWNLAHGSLESSLFGMSFLGNHGNYIAFLILPIYYFFQHPLMLVYLKLFSFFTGAFLIYYIARRNLGWQAGILLMLLFILHTPNTYMLFFEFDFESLAVGLLCLAYVFYQQNRFIPFLLTAAAICLCKENLPALVCFWGFYALLFRKEKRWKWGITPVVMGAAIFLTVMFVLTPNFRQHLSEPANPYVQAFYFQQNSANQSIIATLSFYPKKLAGLLLTPDNGKYLQELFGAHLLTAFFSPQVLLISLPILLQNLLGNYTNLKLIIFQYHSSIIVFIFLATIHSLGWMRSQLSPAKYAIIFTIFISLSLHQIYIYRDVFPEKISNWLKNPLVEESWELVNSIPPDAGVVSTFTFLDPLNNRKDLYTLYNVWLNVNLFTKVKPFTLPADVTYALINFSDPWVLGAVLRSDSAEEKAQHIQNLFINNPWSVVRSYNDIVLLQRGGEGPPLITVAQEPFVPAALKKSIGVSDLFQLEGLQTVFHLQTSRPTLSAEFYWKVLKHTSEPLYFHLYIKNSRNEKVYHQMRIIGYSLYPTPFWQTGEYIKEFYNYSIPAFVPGDYWLYLMVTNQYQEPVTLHGNEGGSDFEGNLVKLGILHVKP